MTKQIFLVFTMTLLAGCAADVAMTETTTEGRAAQTAAMGEDAVDLFAGDMPELLAGAHVRQLDGELLDLPTMHALFDYALGHADDARPWILLARDSMRNEWGGLAVRQYRSAIEAEVRAAYEPGVLADLVRIAGSYGGVEHREATELLSSVYGARALSMIDDALEAARSHGETVAIARMEALRSAVVGI